MLLLNIQFYLIDCITIIRISAFFVIIKLFTQLAEAVFS